MKTKLAIIVATSLQLYALPAQAEVSATSVQLAGYRQPYQMKREPLPPEDQPTSQEQPTTQDTANGQVHSRGHRRKRHHHHKNRFFLNYANSGAFGVRKMRMKHLQDTTEEDVARGEQSVLPSTSVIPQPLQKGVARDEAPAHSRAAFTAPLLRPNRGMSLQACSKKSFPRHDAT